MSLYRTLLLVGLLGWAVLIFDTAWAQVARALGEVTVDDLVAQALADNLELHATQAEVAAAQGRLQQAGLRPNPVLELGVQHNVAGPDNNLTASVTLPLDLNGRQAGRLGVASGELEMKRAQVAERARRLRAEVRLKAGELLAAQRNLRLTEELLQINQQALVLLQSRVSRGAAPPLEANLLRVEVNRLDASRHLRASQVEVQALYLKTLLGLGPDAPLRLQGDLRTPPVLLERDAGLAQALATRPDLWMAQAEVAMAEAAVRKEQAEGRWDASVNVGYMRQDAGYDLRGLTARGGTQPIQDVFHYVGAGVAITLPVRQQNQGNIAAALASVTAAQRRLTLVTLTIRQEVTAAFTQYDASQHALDIYTHGVHEVARQNLAVVRQAYELGRWSLLDLIAEQRRYLDIATGYTESLKQVYDAVLEIERTVGTPAR